MKIIFKNELENYGLTYDNDTLTIIYPKELGDFSRINFENINEENDRCKEKIKKFIKTLKFSEMDLESENNSKSEFSAFESMLWIIKDYYNNGLMLRSQMCVVNNQSGKILWKKTLKNIKIINNKPYLENIYSKKRTQQDDEIINCYKWCLEISTKLIGYFYRVSEYISEVYENKYWIFLIDIELNKTFNSQTLICLKHLKNIITKISLSDNKKSFSYQTKKYHQVFELMLSSMLSNYDITKVYPKATWRIGEITSESTSLRPDIVRINENEKTIYIFDAKFYHYDGKIKSLPRSSDIQKQLFYAYCIKNNEDIRDTLNIHNENEEQLKIKNIFILPRDLSSNNKGENKIEKLGECYFAPCDELESIKTYFIDLNYLIENYQTKVADEKITEWFNI